MVRASEKLELFSQVTVKKAAVLRRQGQAPLMAPALMVESPPPLARVQKFELLEVLELLSLNQWPQDQRPLPAHPATMCQPLVRKPSTPARTCSALLFTVALPDLMATPHRLSLVA